MYKSNLAASFDEEDSIEQQLTKMRFEIDQLEENKSRLN
jgi:hypothetical protein